MLYNLSKIWYWGIVLSAVLLGAGLGYANGDFFGLLGGALAGALLGWIGAEVVKPYIPITIVMVVIAATISLGYWLWMLFNQ